MSKRKIGAVLLSISLLMIADGCKKKGPAPPPPPKTATTPRPEPPPPARRPTIANFTAEPSSIERGQSATLRWSTEGANSVTINPGLGAVDPGGSRSVSPSSTTEYELIARGPGGEARQTVTVRVTDRPAPPPTNTREPELTFAEMVARELTDVYFDYDKNDVREDARAGLTRNADRMKAMFQKYPTGVVVVEGHCDERGSAEYNLGLGDRRSTSARDFLVQLGVSADRLKTVSFGKERPQCTESDESCWQKNRRAHFSAQ